MTYTNLRQSTYRTVKFCLSHLFQRVKTPEMLCLLLSGTLTMKSFSQKLCFFSEDIFTDPDNIKNVFKDSIALKAFYRS